MVPGSKSSKHTLTKTKGKHYNCN